MAPVEKYVRGAVTFSQLDGREWSLLPVDVVTVFFVEVAIVADVELRNVLTMVWCRFGS